MGQASTTDSDNTGFPTVRGFINRIVAWYLRKVARKAGSSLNTWAISFYSDAVLYDLLRQSMLFFNESNSMAERRHWLYQGYSLYTAAKAKGLPKATQYGQVFSDVMNSEAEDDEV